MLTPVEGGPVVHAWDHGVQLKGVECRTDVDVIDESPAAYKPIDAVIAAQADLTRPVHALKQIIVVKG